MNSKNVLSFFQILQQENQNPKGELYYTNPFTLLIAVILSARATDAGVNKATKNLFEYVSTPEDVLTLGQEKLLNAIKTIGLYPTKGKNILATCKILVNQFNSQVPSTRQDLERLPGVGRKTANVILNIAFKQPTIAVDTHVFRVSNRTQLAPGKTPEEVEEKLLAITPDIYHYNAHHWLILHGRYVCKSRAPLCNKCVIEHLCAYENKNIDLKNTIK